MNIFKDMFVEKYGHAYISCIVAYTQHGVDNNALVKTNRQKLCGQ